MCIGILLPTWRRFIVFLFFAGLMFSGALVIFAAFQPLQLYIGLPLYVIGYSAVGIIIQLIYSYIMACIYAAAYVRLESKIRKQYPHMNDIVEKRKK
jgi:hypothetical protein